MGWASVFFAILSCWMLRELLALLGPDRYLHWKLKKFCRYWRLMSRRSGGRPRISAELIELIRRMSLENPLLGSAAYPWRAEKAGL